VFLAVTLVGRENRDAVCLSKGDSQVHISSAMNAIPAHFSAHVCCDQTAGWMKMPLSTEPGLGPGDIMLDGGPSFL